MKTITNNKNGLTVTENILEETDFVLEDIKNFRNNTCKSCEYYKRNEEILEKFFQEECTKCSCILSTKIVFVSATCPIGKW